MDRNTRDAYRDHPHFQRTEEFCARYDGPAFDQRAETLPLSFFEPFLERVFARPMNSICQAALEGR